VLRMRLWGPYHSSRRQLQITALMAACPPGSCSLVGQGYRLLGQGLKHEWQQAHT
jgi:hypothetical protein